MNQVLLIARRELFAYLRSPLGAVVIAGALLFDGLWFYYQATLKLVSADVLREFFWVASGTTMIASLLLSMRLFAE
jgi:ABC-2 type transport system permease protein